MKKLAVFLCFCLLLTTSAVAQGNDFTSNALVFRINSQHCLMDGAYTEISANNRLLSAYLTNDNRYFMVPLSFLSEYCGWTLDQYSDSCDVTTPWGTYGFYYNQSYVYVHGQKQTYGGRIYCQLRSGAVFVSASSVAIIMGREIENCYDPLGIAIVKPKFADKNACIRAVFSLPDEKPQYTGYLALTFDDGPSGALTERLLDGLAERGAHATFFICNYRIASYSSPMTRYIAEGHEVANHSANHTSLTSLSAVGIDKELDATNTSVACYTGVTPTLMRPPGGSYNSTVLEEISKRGMSCIIWSVDPMDWKVRDTEKIARHIIDNASDGDIILLHDLYSTSVDAALMVIDELSQQGYAFVTVSELAAIKGYDLESGGVYTCFK